MIKLKKHLNYKGLMFEPGAVLPLPPEMEAKMVKAGSAEYYTPAKKTESAKNPAEKPSDALSTLEGLLKTTNKKALIAYAEHAKVKDVHDKMKNEDITKAIMDDARVNGVYLDGLTDEQLMWFATLCDIEAVKEDMPRDEVLAAIKSHFSEVANARP